MSPWQRRPDPVLAQVCSAEAVGTGVARQIGMSASDSAALCIIASDAVGRAACASLAGVPVGLGGPSGLAASSARTCPAAGCRHVAAACRGSCALGSAPLGIWTRQRLLPPDGRRLHPPHGSPLASACCWSSECVWPEEVGRCFMSGFGCASGWGSMVGSRAPTCAPPRRSTSARQLRLSIPDGPAMRATTMEKARGRGDGG